MDNTVIQKIRDELSKNDSIGIAVGQNPALDEMAAALSLYLILKEANKKVTVACPTEPIVEISNLVGIDKVTNKFEGQGGDLVVSFPYEEGEIEKVSYTLERGFLNIIVKAAGQSLSFSEKDVKYSSGGTDGLNLLFVVGTPNLSNLGSLINSDQLQNTKIVNIDNKQDNQGYGDIVAVSANATSVSELIGDLLLALGLQIDRDVAQNLMSGISDATGNFQDPSTSALAFEVASVLMRSGAKRETRQQPPRQQQNAPKIQRESRFSQNQPAQQQRPRFNNSDSQDNNREEKNDDQNTPNDWLAPKVYKGSSNF